MAPSFRELMVKIGCTGIGEEEGIEPLAAYLARGHELTPYLREWLLAMLRREKAQTHHLLFKRRVGRPKDSAPVAVADGIDMKVMVNCTSATPPSIEPLAQHLEAHGEFTPLLRNWLISMLRRENSQTHVLQYITHGRRASIESVMSLLELEGRYCDLHGTMITDGFCETLAQELAMDRAPVEQKGGRRIHRFGFDTPEDWGDNWVPTIVQFEVGNELNDFQIHHLLAAEFETSLATVKRMLLALKTARAIE